MEAHHVVLHTFAMGPSEEAKHTAQMGVTAALLHRHGVAVFSQFEFVLADQHLRQKAFGNRSHCRTHV
jgi:hypothetical protein